MDTKNIISALIALDAIVDLAILKTLNPTEKTAEETDEEVNFSTREIALLARAISIDTSLSMRLNKYGNLDVSHKDADKVHFVFYKKDGEYFVRKRNWEGDGKGFNQHGGIIGNCKFSTMEDAVSFFLNHIKNHSKNYLLY